MSNQHSAHILAKAELFTDQEDILQSQPSLLTHFNLHAGKDEKKQGPS